MGCQPILVLGFLKPKLVSQFNLVPGTFQAEKKVEQLEGPQEQFRIRMHMSYEQDF